MTTGISFYKHASINVSAFVKSAVISVPVVYGNTALGSASASA